TRRHRFVATFLYQLPYGFDVSGVALLQSGSFLTPFFGNADPSGTGATVRGFTSSQRPDCVGDGNLSDPTSDLYFDRSAFVRPANNIGRFGTCPVGTLTGPGTRVFSMTIGKSVTLASPSKVRVEVAFSNLFNTENLDVPGTLNITSGSFGRITRTQPVDQAGPRTVQFSLRYSFGARSCPPRPIARDSGDGKRRRPPRCSSGTPGTTSAARICRSSPRSCSPNSDRAVSTRPRS